MNNVYDVTIIGGGPIGMFTAFYSGMRDLKTKLIESSYELGGKITMFYPEKILRDIGGIPEIAGADLVKQLKEQTFTFDPTIEYGQFVSHVQRLSDGHFRLESKTGEVHYTKTIILTCGAGIFKPIKLEVEDCERFEDHTLHYNVKEFSHYKGKHVCISGGGNSAVDWANELSEIAKSVTVVHRRDEFGGHEKYVAEMKKHAHVYSPYKISRLNGPDEKLETIMLQHCETGEEITIESEELIVNHGIKGDLGGIMDWGLEMENGKFVVNASMETNIPGIYAAGDAVTYPTKLKLIAGGFTEGPIAINSAARYLEPTAEEMAMYSTHHEKLLTM